MAGTERLWLTEPRRKTCLAQVTTVRGRRFTLDRSLFRPKGTAYRHHQRADLGTIWVKGGNKHQLASVFEQNGRLWHRIDGRAPPVGTEIQCHLDQERRGLDSRCHTAMHLLLAACHQHDGPPLAADPAVKGGGRFRLEFATWHLDPNQLAAWLERANQFVDQDRLVNRDYVEREHAEHRVTPQPFEEGNPVPGPETTLEVVEIEDLCCYPCDGTHAERTSEVGRILIRQAEQRDDGTFLVIGEVPREA